MIIDAHVHILAHEGRDREDFLLDECRRNGVRLAIVSGIGRMTRFPDSAEVRAANDQAMSFAGRAPERLRWIAYLNPQNPDWPAELDRCLAAGAIGVKLWVSLKDATGSLDHTVAVLRRAGELRRPVVIHTFNRTDANLPGEIHIEEFTRLADTVPGAFVIGAHAGGNWRRTLGVLRGRTMNACVDTCGCFPEAGMVESLVRDLGVERVIFGSDLLGRSLPSQRAKVQLAGLDADAREAVLWRNAARIFGLSAADLQGAPAFEPEAPGLRPMSGLPARTEDHFCFCGHWPFFKTPCPTPRDLQPVLEGAGVSRAYVADLGGLFHLDLESANSRFLRQCEGASRIAPLATANPIAQNWRSTLGPAGGGFAGVFISPYLHNWRLDDAAAEPFLDECARRGLPLWVNAAFGDHRFRHPACGFRPPSSVELAAFAKKAPGNGYVIQGLRWDEMAVMLDARDTRDDIRFEISRLTDLTGALGQALAQGAGPRLVMGSEFPLRVMDEVWWAAVRQ